MEAAGTKVPTCALCLEEPSHIPQDLHQVFSYTCYAGYFQMDIPRRSGCPVQIWWNRFIFAIFPQLVMIKLKTHGHFRKSRESWDVQRLLRALSYYMKSWMEQLDSYIKYTYHHRISLSGKNVNDFLSQSHLHVLTKNMPSDVKHLKAVIGKYVQDCLVKTGSPISLQAHLRKGIWSSKWTTYYCEASQLVHNTLLLQLKYIIILFDPFTYVGVHDSEGQVFQSSESW